MEKKDIIILMPDQLRWDCLGAYGNKIIKTPNIDKIAEEGVIFKNAYTTSPLCMPARASFVSGLYPHL
ncbi:MAG TPA: sulfatase-like hydrolase/transferase, partial [bacterium]|nr:sulfatase-like hydrolase/transferase [bacterium]